MGCVKPLDGLEITRGAAVSKHSMKTLLCTCSVMTATGQSDVFLDEDGEANPIISWSDLHVLYQLPDGSKWAEHGNFYDCEDLVGTLIIPCTKFP